MSNVIDLDKARAARREAGGEGPVVRFGENDYTLAAELPYAVLEALRDLTGENATGAVANLAEGLLGEHYEAFKASNPSVEDLNALIAGAMEGYGLGTSPLDSSA